MDTQFDAEDYNGLEATTPIQKNAVSANEYKNNLREIYLKYGTWPGFMEIVTGAALERRGQWPSREQLEAVAKCHSVADAEALVQQWWR